MADYSFRDAGLTAINKNPAPSSFISFLKMFSKHPFETLDYCTVFFRGKLYRSPFRDDLKVRQAILELSIFFMGVWAFCGFDSSITQFDYVISNIPNLLLGRVDLLQLEQIYLSDYGKGMHYSAIVIYGLVYFATSRYLRSIGCARSENICLSVAFTLLNISLFEWFWMAGFCVFQGQVWVVQFRWAQARILLQEGFFTFTGSVALLGVLGNHRLNFDRNTKIVLAFTLITMSLWIGYGLYAPLKQATIEREGAEPFTNSPLFPQTLYTIDVKPLDGIAIGEQFYFEDNKLHLLNVVCKVFMSMSVYSVLKIRRK